MRLDDYIKNYNDTFGDFWNEIKLIIYGVFAFLNLDIDIVHLLAIMMFVDTFLGVIKSIIVFKYKFTFKKLLWGIITKTVILLVPMILAVVALALGYDFRWLIDAVLKILVVSEAISSISNIISIKEKKPIENNDFITKLLHVIRNFFVSKVIFILKNIQEEEDEKQQ